MKRFNLTHALLLCIILILTGQAWSNEAPKIFVQSYIKHIVAGGHHSLAIDENGCLWAWGNNGSGRLGNVDAGSKSSLPVPVNTINGDGQLSSIISVDGGFSHSIALLEDGRVLAWGNNSTLQLGNVNSGQSSFLPVYVNGPGNETFLTNVIAVAAGKYHSVVLCIDGTVWTWGANYDGQLGNNTPINQYQSRPTQVVNSSGTGFLSDIVAISAGAYHTLALTNSGIVMVWGNNESGQLGLGSDAINHQTPVPINELTGITHISAGEYHSLARKSNGTVWAWGNNESGELGYLTNNNSNSNFPRQVLASDGVNNLMNVVDIAAGGSHSLALKNDGTLMAWGNNDNGQLGDGSKTSTLFPTYVKRNNGFDLLENIVAISAGDIHSLARTNDGHIMAWGGNNEGQLGNNGKITILPAYVLDNNAESALQLGEQYFFVHVNEDQASDSIPLVLRDTDGQQVSLSAISSNESLMLPANFEFNHNNLPFKLSVPSEESVDILFSFLTEADQYGSGQISIIATDSLGASDIVQIKVQVLPVNDPPMISNIENVEIDEDSTSGLIPFTVLDVDGDMLSVFAQSLNPALIPKDGLILSGNSSHRYLQIFPNPDQSGAADIILSVSDPSGLTSNMHFYVNVKPVNDAPTIRIWPGVRQIACGYYHNIAIQQDWTVWAWGYNGQGQLGYGTTTQYNLPIQVKGPNDKGYLTDIVAVAAGNQHSVALTGDGHVLTWGGNTYGQLGNATFESSYVPIYVLNDDNLPIEKVIAIASGANHVLLLTENNELWAWGKNENGQLADNNPTAYNRPIRVQGLPSNRIVQIAAGDSHSMVLLDNGEIWSWGDNSFGQSGLGDIVSSLIPAKVLQENGNPLANIVAITVGDFHSLALSSDGYIWAFGNNQDGQLGNGSTANLSKPAKVQHPDNGNALSGIVYIASGSSHSMAIQKNDVIWAWGNNKYGQLGDGTKQNQSLPEKVNSNDIPVNQVLTMDAGKQHSVVHTGNVWAWGANYSFQLGTGTSQGSLIPIQTRSPDGSNVFSPGIFPLEFYTADGIPAQPILVSLHDLETPSTDLLLTPTSSDTQILPQENIQITGTDVNRQIILTPNEDRTGKVVVELKVDDNTDHFSKQLTLGVNKFSLAPAITHIDPILANEDDVIHNIDFTIDDPDTPIDQLIVQVTSSNTGLVPNHPEKLTVSGENSNRTLTITPLENQSGETMITIRVSDGINIARTTFTLTVRPINDPPTISPIEDLEILSEEFSKSIGYMISDLESEAEHLTTWAISSNPAIVPNDSYHLIISGDSSQKTLAITPSKDEAGELTITVCVSDGEETQFTRFKLTVQSYKKSPQLSDIENQIMQEDSTITVDFVVTDADSDPNELSFYLLSSNKYVIPNDSANLSITGTGENRTLHIKPKVDQAGSVRITIEARDLDNLYDQTSFMVTVQNVNDPPTISSIDDIEIKENKSTPPIEFTIYDADLAVENLILTITSINELVVPNDSIHLKLTGEASNRTLVITPLENVTGETTIRLQLSDGEIPVWESFVLKVAPENFPPEMSPIGFQVTEVSTSLDIRFTVSDSEMPAYLLHLSAKSSNPSIVPNDTAHLHLTTGDGNERQLKVTPIDGESGQLTITLILKDDLSTTEQSFSLIVNHPPGISSVSEQETDEDKMITQILFTVEDEDTDSDHLTLSAQSANADLVPNDDEHLKFQGVGIYRYLTLVPAADQNGQTQITVYVTDGYSVRSTQFDITVLPVNDPPFILPVVPIITNEDIAVSSVPLTIGDLETSAEVLTLEITSDNELLLPLQNISLTGQSETRYLSLTPTTNQYGTAMLTLKVTDPDGLTASQEVLIQVKSVNDIPVAVNQSYETRMNVPLLYTLQANDIDGDALTYAISAMPEKGNVTLINASTGEFKYQPFPDQYGSDSFLFVVSDGINTSVVGTTAIKIHDDIPPEIVLNGLNPDYIMKGYQFLDKGVVSAYDNADGNLLDEVETIGSVNTSVPGTYHLTYRVKDYSGNMTQVTRDVVVMESSGQLLGTVGNIPDVISDPEDEIRVQLLDALSNKVLREANLTMEDQSLHFKFLYLPFQTYVLRLIVSDHDTTQGYLTETVDQLVLFQGNNQEVHLNVPELTKINLCYQLSVSPGGDYNLYDSWQYTIIDYLNGKTIIEETSSSSQFSTYLKNGSYRLVIIAKGYEPFEYVHGDGNPYIRIDQANMHVTVLLKETPDFYPDPARLNISHTLFSTDTDHGFNLWFVRKAYNTNDDFLVTIQSEENEMRLDCWDGIDIVDNHPYVYTWTVAAAENSTQPLYQKKEPIGMDIRYTVAFHFYQGANLIQSYTVSYILQSENSTQISPEKKSLQDFMDDTVRYETQSETQFYPLAGGDLNISFKDSTGEINHKGISIPPIPLDYLEIPDSQKELHVTDILIANIKYYTFGGDAVSDVIRIDFKTLDGDEVLYNSKSQRNENAPTITVPLRLNRHSPYFEGIQQNKLSLAKDILHVMVNDSSDPSSGFQTENYPFVIQDDGLVLLKIKHLSTITLEINDNWNAFVNKDLDDGRCFMYTIYYSNPFSWALVWLALFISGLGFIRKSKGKQS
jgi:alpha-tubulin suppressor-like RCC1 family protein